VDGCRGCRALYALIMNSKLYEPAHMVVLTGGPCSGKSTSLAYLTEKLSDQGFMVAVIPETATMVTNNGINRHIMDRMGQIRIYQESIIDIQLMMEETYKNAMEGAFPDKKKILLLDRGVMDTKAYLPKKEWDSILAKKGFSEINLRDRYAGVIHMLTAADGLPGQYSADGNPARLEKTIGAAIEADRRTRNAWLGHRRLVVIGNQISFDEKIKRVLNVILHHLGHTVFVGGEKKYLVDSVDIGSLPDHQRINIEQTYLVSKVRGQRLMVKRRSQYGSCMYFLVRGDVKTRDGRNHTEEEIITVQEYSKLLGMKDPKLNPVIKDRICFIWENSHYEIDIYAGTNEGLVTFETGLLAKRDFLPPFVKIKAEITNNRNYSSRALAGGKAKKTSAAPHNIRGRGGKSFFGKEWTSICPEKQSEAADQDAVVSVCQGF